MLGIFVISGCVLMTCAGPPISGYSLGSLSSSRNQDYSPGYRSTGFVGMKDPQRGSYAIASNQRHMVTSGPSNSPSGSAYTSDSAYYDTIASQSNGFGGHSSGSKADPLTSPSSSPYSSNEASHASSSDPAAYSSSGSTTGLGGYSSVSSASNNQVDPTYSDYSDGAGSHVQSNVAGLSSGERGPAEYSSSSYPSQSYASYTIGGPKASAYTSGIGSHRGHGPNSFSSSPGISYMSGVHHAGSSSGSFHPAEGSHSTRDQSISSGPNYSLGPSYSSGPSLSSLLAGMHSNGGHSNYIHGNGGHRPSPMGHIFSSSNISPSYTSRGPSSGYFPNSPFPRGGGKIILVKDGGGHVGHMYSGDQHGFNGGIFGPGYKIRSVASGPNYGSSLGGGYNGGSGHSSSSNGVGGLFSFL